MFLSAECSLLRAEGFFCNLDILYGLAIGKVFGQKFLYIFFFSCKFCLIFGHKTLDPDPYQMNPDPKPWVRELHL
jgi:hypothetical protein